jgi:hypothetical protein
MSRTDQGGDMSGCPICGNDLPPQDTSNGGRPRIYCGTPCRRAAEFELRRLRTLLERVEESISFWYLYGGPKRRLTSLRAEHVRLTGRLLTLLDGVPEEVSPPAPNLRG